MRRGLDAPYWRLLTCAVTMMDYRRNGVVVGAYLLPPSLASLSMQINIWITFQLTTFIRV